MIKFLRLVFIVAVVIVCLGLAGIAFLADRLPRMAAEKFGPPSSALSLTQRALYSYRLVSNSESLLTPADDQGQPRTFKIEIGESVNSISTRLEEERFIANADTFRTYLIYKGLDTRVQAGSFEISPSMTPLEISTYLLDPVPEDVQFVILAGWRMEEIAAALPTSGLQVTGDEFLEIVNRPPADILPADLPALASLEGFLMPGSYVIKRDSSAKELANIFLTQFAATVTTEMREGFANQGLDLLQAVTLASIVQKEAVVEDEQPVIASVFYNRLAAGMRLESDPTVQYALGYQLLKKTWWKNPLSSADLRFDSRYNTYVYSGLPPGPIASPSAAALRAVANPAETGYYYFRAQCDGSSRHFFSVTYEEHLNNACP